jgi:hypothetical protein
MNNPFRPPATQVADVATSKRPSWPRTAFLVLVFAALSLVLSWFVVPALVSLLPAHVDEAGLVSTTATPAFLAVDLALSFLVFVAGCYLAARLSHGHGTAAAAGVAAIGWLVYFTEVGGLQGMLGSEFPAWYEFFPSHILAAFLAVALARR